MWRGAPAWSEAILVTPLKLFLQLRSDSKQYHLVQDLGNYRAQLSQLVKDPLLGTGMMLSSDHWLGVSHHEYCRPGEGNLYPSSIISTSGGMGKEDDRLLRRLAEQMSIKRGGNYTSVVSFIRIRFRFDLLKTCLIAMRGYIQKANYHRNEDRYPRPIPEDNCFVLLRR